MKVKGIVGMIFLSALSALLPVYEPAQQGSADIAPNNQPLVTGAGGITRSSTFALLITPGTPAPGCVPAPTR